MLSLIFYEARLQFCENMLAYGIFVYFQKTALHMASSILLHKK
jgi:hypothetical protein